MAVNIKGKAPTNPYEAHLNSEPIQATTTVYKSKVDGGTKTEALESSTEEVVNKGVVMSANEMYKIEVGGGMTVNLGNFESARLDIRIVVPCAKSEIEDAYEWASDWVSGKIQESMKAIKG